MITLRLGALVVHFSTDHYYANDLKHRLKNSIKYHRTFSFSEKARLQHYLQRRLKTPENMNNVNIEFGNLVKRGQQRTRYILVSITFADDKVTQAKKEYLANLYAALGLDKKVLNADIDTFLATNTTVKNVCVPIRT